MCSVLNNNTSQNSFGNTFKIIQFTLSHCIILFIIRNNKQIKLQCIRTHTDVQQFLYPRFKKWGYTVLHLSVCPSIRPSIRPLKFFVKDFSTNMQARVVIFGKEIGDNMLYCGVANQPSALYPSLCLSDFLSFHTGGGRVVRWCWVNFQCLGILQFKLQ